MIKKSLMFGLVLMMIIPVAFIMTGCRGINEDNLIGSWRFRDIEQGVHITMIITFNEGGQGVVDIVMVPPAPQPQEDVTINFTWNTENGQLFINEPVILGTSGYEVWEIVMLTRNRLRVIEDGEEMTLRRVRR